MYSDSKQELIHLIRIYFKDRLKIDEEDEDLEYYDEPHLCMLHNLDKFYININDTWNKNKKRIELEMKREIKEECAICNEIKKLHYCNECLNQYCILCYAHIVIKNKGTHVCPYCRDGEDRIHLNTPYNNTLKTHRYEFAIKLIESNM